MADLAEWLLAQYDVDEKVARAADAASNPAAEWEADEPDCISAGGYILATGIDDESIGDHIARHDPTAVLDDLAAKRRIVEQYRAVPAGIRVAGYEDAFRVAAKRDALGDVLHLLAYALRDRDGYDPAWTPPD